MLMQYAAIFDGSKMIFLESKRYFLCSKQRSLLGTLRRFFKTNINNVYNYEGPGIKTFVGRHF